jgi:two-component system cell cycle sensor histidine kinase/response regulator CckA
MDHDASAGRVETLLIVDDEEVLVELLRRLVERHGYRAFAASSGREALEIYEANRGEIDLVLTDLMMPEMDGKQLAQELLRRDPNVRILISTGYSEPTDISYLLDAGARGIVMKPYQADRLIEAIRAALSDAPREDSAA